MGKAPASLKAHITRLEMTAPPKASMPVPVNIQTAIMRAPEKLKYLASSETGAGAYIVDALPEETARRLGEAVEGAAAS